MTKDQYQQLIKQAENYVYFKHGCTLQEYLQGKVKRDKGTQRFLNKIDKLLDEDDIFYNEVELF